MLNMRLPCAFVPQKKDGLSIVCSEALLSVLQKDCKNKSLRCYMLELLMVIDEEAVMGTYADCISDFNANLPTDNSVSPAGGDAASFLHKN